LARGAQERQTKSAHKKLSTANRACPAKREKGTFSGPVLYLEIPLVAGGKAELSTVGKWGNDWGGGSSVGEKVGSRQESVFRALERKDGQGETFRGARPTQKQEGVSRRRLAEKVQTTVKTKRMFPPDEKAPGNSPKAPLPTDNLRKSRLPRRKSRLITTREVIKGATPKRRRRDH